MEKNGQTMDAFLTPLVPNSVERIDIPAALQKNITASFSKYCLNSGSSFRSGESSSMQEFAADLIQIG